MRRGHPGVGGWRGENHRHFRPRNGGANHFRPSRPFGPPNSGPRYPPPQVYRGSRTYRHTGHSRDNVHSEHRDRTSYRNNHEPRFEERGVHSRHRQMPPYNRQNDDHGNPNFYPKTDQYHVNNMGDVDHRNYNHSPNKNNYNKHPISPWMNPPPFEKSNYYDDSRNPPKTPRHYNMSEDAPLPDYSGHRPPASDHYSATPGTNNNNSQYSHSVDDTVDIVRKRLLNRDKQKTSESSTDNPTNTDRDLRQHTQENYQDPPQEQPSKKKKQKQNMKFNCDKIKNKIVHQLFKMEKVKIHKLLDNPSSSTKFEYAISSLITEGQNSLNKHLRSAAEKSLYSSSTDFIQDDRNTIYEDTFMKQMQGLVDPKVTLLLEDIKPIVMAELSKVLQFDDYQMEGMYDVPSHIPVHLKEEPHHYPYSDEIYNTDQYSQDTYYDQNQTSIPYDDIPPDNMYEQIHPSNVCYNDAEPETATYHNNYECEEQSSFTSKPLYKRRAPKSPNNKSNFFERRKSRSSIDIAFRYLNDPPNRGSSKESEPVIPFFDPNSEQISEDEDPFAELDKQYHVAVDHNFIENTSRASSPQHSLASFRNKSPNIIKTETERESPTQKETPPQLLSIAKSLTKQYSFVENKNKIEDETHSVIKKEIGECIEKENLQSSFEPISKEKANVTHATSEKVKDKGTTKVNHKTDNATNTKSVLQSNTRKRSVDQKPSHRKEKRKKSSHSESHDSSKSDMYEDTSNDTLKDDKTPDSTEKSYSDKYVKRKEPHKKSKDTEVSKTEESQKLNTSNTSSHSISSPKDNDSHESLIKSDIKTKLKPIDMFLEQPKKTITVHQAHRNTAPTSQTNKNISTNTAHCSAKNAPPPSPAKIAALPQSIAKSYIDNKPRPVIPTVTTLARKLSRRHIGTQIIFKVRSRECQTDKVKLVARNTQTDPISFTSLNAIASTNPLERMKEIDMEIQQLLQEKFQLYNSLDNKALSVPMNTIPSLSMRVFKVGTDQDLDERSIKSESNISEDATVGDFTSIPTEDLEKIALESLEEIKDMPPTDPEPPSAEVKRSRRAKVLKKTWPYVVSPTTKRNRKTKAPNISLIEQIITDERPIEEIISLDNLETTPVKAKKKNQKLAPKKGTMKRLKGTKSASDDGSLVHIKECSVVLERIDISEYLRPSVEPEEEQSYGVFIVDNSTTYGSEETMSSGKHETEIVQEVEEIGSETERNKVIEESDLQFDMLDVSEDIVIGDCDGRADKEVPRMISGDIILDNSQSSVEDLAVETAEPESECKMYDYSSDETLRRDAVTVTGNADAVLAIECIDNGFVAACLDGNVYHFSGDGRLLKTLRGSNLAVTCLTIVNEKYGSTVYTGSLDSRIRYFDLETGLEKGPECNVLSPIQTMDRAWDTVFVGTRTGFVLQFECKNNMLIPVSSVKFSEQSILALRALKEGPRKVLLVAARSESVTVKDAQTGLLLRTLEGPKMTVYTLLFEGGKVYCGTSSQNIHVFDYTTGAHAGSHAGGKGAVCVRARGGLLFAGCYDGCVYVFRAGAAQALAQLRGPSLMLLSLALTGTKIIAGYKDRSLYIWKMPLAILQEMVL